MKKPNDARGASRTTAEVKAGIDGSEPAPAMDRILLVDDEESVLLALARELTAAGLQVETCTNPHEAVQRLNQCNYALVISDNQMPGLSGIALLEQVKRIAPDTLRFMLTGYADMDGAIRAINDGGIHRYLTKPWRREELHRAVREALDVWRLRADQRRLTEEVQRRNEELVAVNRELQHLASRDRMTGLLNHAEFQHALRLAVATSNPSALVWLGLVDVDDFKAINDKHGHPAGDAVLRGIADLLCASLRTDGDAVYRYGGEEFAILLREIDEAEATSVLERLRIRVADSPIPTPAGELSVSVSIGFGVADPGAAPETLLAEVDRALYRAKRAGKNRVERVL